MANTSYTIPAVGGGDSGGSGNSGWVDDGTVVRLNNVSDNVGIGVTDPSCKLTVAGCISAQTIVYDAASNSNQWLQVWTTVKEESGGWGTGSAGGWTDDGAVVRLSTDTDKVGIGITGPTEKLSVAGNISARDIVYDSEGTSVQWNDVFSTVNTNSGFWEENRLDIATVVGASANWENTYSHVLATSSDWSESRFKTIATDGQTDIVADSVTDTLNLSAMGDFEIHHHAGTDTVILSSKPIGAGEMNEYSFKIISTSGQSDVIADTTTDTLNLSAMGNFEIQHHPLTDTVILSAGAGGGGGGGEANENSFKTISTSGQTDIVADTTTDTLNLSAMGGMEIHHHDGTDTVILSSGASGGGGSSVTDFHIMMISETFR